MDILLVSNEDACRSRIAEELLNRFGRGMRIFTAGISEGNGVADLVVEVMERNGLDISRRKPVAIASFADHAWNCVVTLTKDAEKELEFLPLKSEFMAHFDFPDPLEETNLSMEEQEEMIQALYQDMDHALYRFYREELSERLMPRCTCGANTFCRCE